MLNNQTKVFNMAKNSMGVIIQEPAVKVSNKKKQAIANAVHDYRIKEKKKLERKVKELERVCYELYQVIGILAGDHGDVFEDPHVVKALDNASKARLVHRDLIPFPDFSRHPLED
jgi:hypothetical protein